MTKPFELEGRELQVNVEAPRGELGIEVLDRDGKALPGYSARHEKVDEIRLPAAWKDGRSLAALQGKVIRLRITLRDAKLYAFQIR